MRTAAAVDLVLAGAGHEIGRERQSNVDPALAERQSSSATSSSMLEAGDAGEGDEVAAVAGLGELGDAAGAADLAELRHERRCRRPPASGWIMPMRRSPRERLVDHGEVARLEDVERHLAARQEQRARQREDRDHVGQGPAVPDRRRSWPCPRPRWARQANSSDDSRRRPARVMSSIGPQASKNWTSCLRAASSFQVRSRRDDVEQLRRSPPRGRRAALSASARSKRA